MESPHRNQPVLTQGQPLKKARGAVILLHGRGASAEDILGLQEELLLPDLAYLAPQAAGHTWYPNSFLAPIERNEPWLTSALELVNSILASLKSAEIPRTRVAILGFSQGACLATEYVARHAERYGGLIAFTGGLIGPEGTQFRYPGLLNGTPCFLGAGDPDPHVPWERVEESASTLTDMGGVVSLKRYSGMGHTINRDELHAATEILETIPQAR